eukprot:TRINITY_DN1813_c0_g1_i1.p1 TRINITY_DN1813_c0_g1~~TRINITY_DN1813_c0_g1_i1.p1  ORF type:complete len:359 (-),score=64.96 TRINITY_DN1813_c0_g1_i1:275-1351(-)
MQISSFTGLKASGSVKLARPCVSHRKGSFSMKKDRRQVSVEAFKVSVLGAAGGIGQPLSLLLKMSPYVTELALYDIANTPGVAADLSHCNTKTQVKAYTGKEEINDALKDMDLVVIPAGVPRKPGMTRDDLFNINAGIVKELVEAVAVNCPQAIIHVISNPVNSTVAIATEVMKAKGVYDPKKVIGVTALDVVRANTFVAEAKGLDIKTVDVPVIGGHAGITILPLLSQVHPAVDFTDEEVQQLTSRIQEAGTEVVKAKAGAGSATLSMAFAAARMAESTLMGLNGEKTWECAFVASNVSSLPYFASKVMLGPEGVEEIPSLPELNEYEKKAYDALIPELQKSIEKGVAFAKGAPVSA